MYKYMYMLDLHICPLRIFMSSYMYVLDIHTYMYLENHT